MTLRLMIDEQQWRDHIAAYRDAAGPLVPVVKGNGYGFGRRLLAEEAATFADEIAVGTAFEAVAVGHLDVGAIAVLTPTLQGITELPVLAVPTVGHVGHVAALRAAGRRGRASIKLASSMQRYGATATELPRLEQAVAHSHLEPHAYVFHPPLAGDHHGEGDAVDEIERWLPLLDPTVPVSVSHIAPTTMADLRARHPQRTWQLRVGTALWHGDKSFVHLGADVVDVRPVSAGQRAGYRSGLVGHDGHLVMIGAGSAHGVGPLADGRSPFHFARRRLHLLEAPHMHTSMVVVPAGEPCPAVGAWVDVQRPLTTVEVDELVWR